MTADELFAQVVELMEAVQAFENDHVEPQTAAEDIFGAATSALHDLGEVLMQWDPDQEDDA